MGAGGREAVVAERDMTHTHETCRWRDVGRAFCTLVQNFNIVNIGSAKWLSRRATAHLRNYLWVDGGLVTFLRSSYWI